MVNIPEKKKVRRTRKKINDVFIPKMNIGIFGHVDHGKTTLTEALTGRWTDTYSEEMKRGITIRLGYADLTLYKCPDCKEHPYSSTEISPICMKKCNPIRTISIVDAPGHETLMATVLSATSIIDGALLVIAANEPCPQPQTAEHLTALEIAQIKNIIIVQNKVDLVTPQEAIKNYEQIKKFVKGTIAENAPIIPVSAQQRINIDALLEAIDKNFKERERESGNGEMLVARSFDVNKPGMRPKELIGGIIGGSIIKGSFKVGDEITILPGIEIKDGWKPLKTKITSMEKNKIKMKEASAGGLVGISTKLDPSLTRGDRLSGSFVGISNLPKVYKKFKLKVHMISRTEAIGREITMNDIKTGTILMIASGVAKTVGIVRSMHGNIIEVEVKIPIYAKEDWKIVISKQINGRWRLIGWGKIIE